MVLFSLGKMAFHFSWLAPNPINVTTIKWQTKYLKLWSIFQASHFALPLYLNSVFIHVTFVFVKCKINVVNKLLRSLYLQDALDGSKPMTGFRSFDNANRRESAQTPPRSRSVLSSFFVKQKTPKLKTGSFSWFINTT